MHSNVCLTRFVGSISAAELIFVDLVCKQTLQLCDVT